MAEYLIQEETLTGIADKIRILNGTTGTMSTSAMKSGLEAANSEVSDQSDLLDQIASALEGKSAGSGGASVETCTVTLKPYSTDNAYTIGNLAYTTLSDGKVNSVVQDNVTISNINNIHTETNIEVVKDTILRAVGSSFTINGECDHISVYTVISGSDLYRDASSSMSTHFFLIRGDCTIMTNAPCFVRDTLILLADGATKLVQDITYDNELLVWDFDNGCYSAAKPAWIKKVQKSAYYYLCEFEDGTELKLVGSDGKCHRVFSLDDNCFLSATDCVGKLIMTSHGPVKMVSCDRVEEAVDFYNVITEHHLNLYANGILTSCRLNNLYPIENMKFLKEHRSVIPMDAYVGVDADLYHSLRLSERKSEDVEWLTQYVHRLQLLKDV